MLKQGVYVATATPYAPDGSIDLGLVREQAQFLIAREVSGICPSGSNGEFPLLDAEERLPFYRAAVEAVSGRAAVVPCPWHPRIEAMIRLSRACEDLGADALFFPPGIYFRYNDREIRNVYRRVREAVSIPVLAYHIPQLSNNPISPALYRQMAEEGIVAGLKDSCPTRERIEELLPIARSTRTWLLTGDDYFALASRSLETDGLISGTANCVPELPVRVWKEQDRAAQDALSRICDAIVSCSFIPAARYLCSRRGLDLRQTREPFLPVTGEEARRLDAALETASDFLR